MFPSISTPLPDTFPVLLADWEEVVRAIVPIVFFVLYGIAQLFQNKVQEQRKKNPLPPRPEPDRWEAKPAPPVAVDQPDSITDSLRREVDEFLKRAQGQQQPRQAPSPPAVTRPPTRREKKPAPPQTEKRPRTIARPLESDTSAGETVAQHVAQHIGASRAVGQHAEQLAAEIGQTDERMQEHLREKFTQPLGSLTPQVQSPAASETRPQQARSAAARDLLDMLATPAGMRQAVVASEILRRPKF
jgi:hypothetical protein